MIDRENVIYNIERCISHVPDACRDCSKYGTWDAMVCMEELLSDALELLKEQEPVKPIDENYWKNTMGRCWHCKAPLPAIEGLRSKFCWMCGKAVKWDA